MTDTYFYEKLIFGAIASSIHLDMDSLRLLPTIPLIPESDYGLFNLLDIVPSSGPMFDINQSIPRFSSTYGELLASQPSSLGTTIAKTNFNNQDNWLPAEPSSGLPKTPIYTPSLADISDAIAKGASFDFKLDSSAYPSPTGIFYPSFPSFIVNSFFLMFNQIAESERFIFTLHFDKMVSLPVNPGSWFTSAAFTQAYQSNGVGWLTGPGTVTWDSLFGANGILQFICNGLLAVSGIVLELQIFGKYDNAMLYALKTAHATSIWPFYLNVANLTQTYTLNSDESITITSQVPSSETLLFAMEAASVNFLMGGSA